MKNSFLQIGILALIILIYSFSWKERRETAPDFQPAFPVPPAFLESDERWVDSVLAELSLDQKIGQMIMVHAYSSQGEAGARAVERIIRRHEVGGVLFFQGDPLSQAKMTNRFQEASRVPLLMAIDGETGLGMRLKNTIRYPAMMSLGAIADNGLIYRMGKDMALQMKRLGIHMNFAPVADVLTDSMNRVIGTRSFGSDPHRVASKVTALMQGMQDQRVLVAAKHFPGHGDTRVDSHEALPLIPHGPGRLDSVEFHPFREAIRHGLTGIMVGHLQVPALDGREHRAATVSRPVVTGILKGAMDFQGLVVTDALNMQALSGHFEAGEAEVEAVKAGNDLLLMPADAGKAVASIRRAVRKGEIPESVIHASCRKILQAKYWAGLAARRPVVSDSLLEDLNRPEFQSHYRKLVQHSLTLVRNREGIVPVKELQKVNLATVTIGEHPGAVFEQRSDQYLRGDHFFLPADSDPRTVSGLLASLGMYNTFLINLTSLSHSGLSPAAASVLKGIDPTARVILNLAGYPGDLAALDIPRHVDAVLVSYQAADIYQDYSVQALFGGRQITGRLPVAAGRLAARGDGINTGPPVRLAYGLPADAGMDAGKLRKMEDIVYKAIRDKAMPGCQVLVARKGMVVWHHAYGYHSYLKRRRVSTGDIYDLASITKITAPLAALMRLRDQGRFHEDSLLGAFDPVPDTSDKAALLISDILTHQSGMLSWIPFYYATLEPLDTSQSLVSSRWSYTYSLKLGEGTYANHNVKYREGYYARDYSALYPVQVAEDLYLHRDIRDSVFHWIHASPLGKKKYKYSGLGFYIFQQIIEELTDTLLYPYVWHNFYAPLGAGTLGYLPLNRFAPERIVPTENDIFYRRQLLRGYVQDQGAAMLGGVSGNAGLFSCANDLAKMMQMYLNHGTYGGREYIDSATLARYSACYHSENEEENRRGLGFDRPVTWEEEEGPACRSASPVSFGHTGFTGTMAWMDPAYDLLFIFLSNRVHPDMGNNRLIDNNIRTKVQQVAYDALLPAEGESGETERGTGELQ